MKNLIKSILVLTFSVAVISCMDDKQSVNTLNEFEKYAAEHCNNAEQYFDKQWDEMEGEYTTLRSNAEQHMEKWDDAMRARYENAKSNWDAFRENYIAELNKREITTKNNMMLRALLPEGIMEDMSNVNNNNVVDVYTHFVSKVSEMKDDMTKEQWKYAEVLWDRLDDRQKQLKDDMNGDEKMVIAKKKLTYTGIKATNRPLAESESEQSSEPDNEKNK